MFEGGGGGKGGKLSGKETTNLGKSVVQVFGSNRSFVKKKKKQKFLLTGTLSSKQKEK